MRFHFLMKLLLIFPLLATAAKPIFQPGKDYKLLVTDNAVTQESATIEVIEFFSYGCPACYRLESTLDQWLIHKPKNIDFKRVPVIFHQGWDVYAKAYYIVSAFGQEAKLSPKLFAAIQEQRMNLSNPRALGNFLAKEGINQQDFQNAYENSPLLEIKLKQGNELMIQYKIMEVPSFVIGGKFYTNAAMAKGDPQRLLQIIEFLIKKSQTV